MWLYSLITISIITMLIFLYKKTKHTEKFSQPSWEKTLDCLRFNDGDIDDFKKNIVDEPDSNAMLNNLVQHSKKKGLSENEIFYCLTGEK